VIDDPAAESSEREIVEHVTFRRPWGVFTNVLEMEGYKVKRIMVDPGGKLSLQLHRHRAEHWVVVKGRALVTIGATGDR